jgi:hypothetical protein
VAVFKVVVLKNPATGLSAKQQKEISRCAANPLQDLKNRNDAEDKSCKRAVENCIARDSFSGVFPDVFS